MQPEKSDSLKPAMQRGQINFKKEGSMQEQITAREYHITCEPANYAGGNEEPLVWEFESGVCIMEGAKFWRIHLALNSNQFLGVSLPQQ